MTSSIYTRRVLTDKAAFGKRAWYYRFDAMREVGFESKSDRVAERMAQRYALVSKRWTPELNSEWICRSYFSAKLIMSATLHLSASEFSRKTNLRLVIPHLRYSAVLSLLRAICYMLPDQVWSNGTLIKISHAAAINAAVERVRSFDRNFADSVEVRVRQLKGERELISYRAPASGDDALLGVPGLTQLCRVLAEVAQFDSELLEHSVLRHSAPESHVLLEQYLAPMTGPEIGGRYFGDMDDAGRMVYLIRKHPLPANLQHMMTEGLVDDFFGAWQAEIDDPGAFDPDALHGLIFDIP